MFARDKSFIKSWGCAHIDPFLAIVAKIGHQSPEMNDVGDEVVYDTKVDK